MAPRRRFNSLAPRAGDGYMPSRNHLEADLRNFLDVLLIVDDEHTYSPITAPASAAKNASLRLSMNTACGAAPNRWNMFAIIDLDRCSRVSAQTVFGFRTDIPSVYPRHGQNSDPFRQPRRTGKREAKRRKGRLLPAHEAGGNPHPGKSERAHRRDLLAFNREIDGETLDNLEAILLSADLGTGTTEEVLGKLREKANHRQIGNVSELKRLLKEEILGILTQTNGLPLRKVEGPEVILGGRERHGKNHDDRQAGGIFEGPGRRRPALRRRYVSPGRDRAARSLGRAHRRPHREDQARRRPAGGALRRLATRPPPAKPTTSSSTPPAVCTPRPT